MIYYTICQVNWETRDPLSIGLFFTKELAINHLFNEVLSYGKNIDNKLNGRAVVQEYEKIEGYIWNTRKMKYNYKIIQHNTDTIVRSIPNNTEDNEQEEPKKKQKKLK